MQNVPFNSWPRFLLAVLAAWTVYILISSLAAVSDLGDQAGLQAWLPIFAGYASGVWPFLLITIALFVAIDWLVSTEKPLGVHIAGMVSITLGLMILYAPLVGISKDLKNGVPVTDLLASISRVSMFNWLWDATVFVGTLAIAYSWRYSRRAAEESIKSLELELANQKLGAELSSLELELLRRQLEPHFLFNALNSVSALIRTADRAAASDALVELGELLRYAIESEQLEYVPVDRELAYARRYLSLQKLRFSDRLQFEFALGEASGAERVPPMLLQPILENAVRHGVEQTNAPVRLKVLVEQLDARVLIEIRNSCPRDETTTRGFGIGLSNLEKRLACVYSTDFQFSAKRIDDEFVVRLSIPVQLANVAPE
ncbi:MAG: histidine kinase [Pseudomonadota bacterium]